MAENSAIKECGTVHFEGSTVDKPKDMNTWNILVAEDSDSIFTHLNRAELNFNGDAIQVLRATCIDELDCQLETLPEVAIAFFELTENNHDTYFKFIRILRNHLSSAWARIIIVTDEFELDHHSDLISNDEASDSRSIKELKSPRLPAILAANLRHYILTKELDRAKLEIEHQVRKRTEELLESKEAAEYNLRQRSDMLAHITHDLRSPLGGILGLSQMLSTGESPEEQQEICHTIGESCKQLLELVNNVLDFSKIESGEFTITRARFSLRECTKSIIQLLAPLANQKGIALESSFGYNVPEVIDGDPVRLKQILQNLIGNAIKFTDIGEVRLRITLERNDIASTLIIYVTDTGVGIPLDEQKQIFERYKQVESGQNGDSLGSGLGLFITKHLVDIMGGTMNLHSELGKGTTFAIRLPLDNDSLPAEGTEKTTIQDTVSINLIEDTTAEILRRKLIAWGFTVRNSSRRYNPGDCVEERTVAIFDQATFTRILNSNLAEDLNRYLGIIWVKTAEIPQELLEILTIPVKTLRLPLRTQAIADACDSMLGSSHKTHLSQSEYSSIWPCLSLRLLLVDENPVDRQLMQIFLQKLKCKVRILTSADDLSNVQHPDRYDAIIMSRNEMFTLSPIPGLPVIVCSGPTDDNDDLKDIAAKIEGILEKPVQPSRLIPLLDHFIARNQLGKTQTFAIH